MSRFKLPDIEIPLESAASNVECDRYNSPFYLLPNQDLNYLLDAYNAMKSLYQKPVNDVLCIGGTLYAGIMKGYERSQGGEVNVEALDIDSRAIITQLFTIYCIKNNGTYNSTMRHLLLDEFIKSGKLKPAAQYSGERVNSEFDYFKKFIDNKLSDERAFELFKYLFSLTCSGSDYCRALPSRRSNPFIVKELFDDLSFKPDFPDDNHSINVYLADHSCSNKFDLAITNNVYEWLSPSLFNRALNHLIKEGGLIEVTTLMNNKPLEALRFTTITVLSNTVYARNVYSLFPDCVLNKPVIISNQTRILRKN